MSEAPRRQRRRATRPATGGIDQTGGSPDPTLGDVDVDATKPPAERDREHERWLREQRPPHWE